MFFICVIIGVIIFLSSFFWPRGRKYRDYRYVDVTRTDNMRTGVWWLFLWIPGIILAFLVAGLATEPNSSGDPDSYENKDLVALTGSEVTEGHGGFAFFVGWASVHDESRYYFYVKDPDTGNIKLNWVTATEVYLHETDGEPHIAYPCWNDTHPGWWGWPFDFSGGRSCMHRYTDEIVLYIPKGSIDRNFDASLATVTK